MKRPTSSLAPFARVRSSNGLPARNTHGRNLPGRAGVEDPTLLGKSHAYRRDRSALQNERGADRATWQFGSVVATLVRRRHGGADVGAHARRSRQAFRCAASKLFPELTALLFVYSGEEAAVHVRPKRLRWSRSLDACTRILVRRIILQVHSAGDEPS